MTFVRSTTNVLRALAVLQILTGAITFIPIAWITSWHIWLGLGPLPDDAVLRYAIRGGAFVQGAIGVLLWVIATDVVRHRPLVITTAVLYLVSSPAFYFIDSLAHMPHFWCVFDCASLFVVGGVLLALCMLPLSNASQTTRPNA